jgi:hypothetical protein
MPQTHKKPKPKRLVIDTNIATSSGESGKPEAKICKNLLDGVKDSGHILVMTDRIKGEWLREGSKYAKIWLGQMMPNQVCTINLAIDNPTLSEKCKEIEKIIKSVTDADERKAMLEDFLLIEAALATDKIIVSHDHEARGFFVKLSQTVPELQLIMWKSPWKQDTKRWVKTDAKIQKRYCLGFGISKAEKSV